MRVEISNHVPSTSYPRHNSYHLHMPLFVLDVVRIFQDHPKFARGLNECHIVDMLKKQCFACGDLESQVRMAIKELEECGFLRCCNNSYRTLGPFARLALARTQRQLNVAWKQLCDMQRVSRTSLSSC